MTANFEDDFVVLLDSYPRALQDSFEKLRAHKLSIQNKDYTRLVANRLRAFYQAQFAAKEFLGKKVAQPGSDFFVETIIFALKLFIETEGLQLEVTSERTLKRERKSIRPDISLWRGENCVCVVECKTQLGYQRYSWLDQFEDREAKLQAIFPDAKMFLLVMTACNWSGFDQSEPKAGFDSSDSRVGEKFFCLLGRYPDGKEIWPVWMPEDSPEDYFQHLLETLLEHISVL